MTTTQITKHWTAEVRCQRCGLTKYVPFVERHAGTKRAQQQGEGLAHVRCAHCPRDQDWTLWTGRCREPAPPTL